VKAKVVLQPDYLVAYVGIYEGRRIELVPAFGDNDWYLSFTNQSGEQRRVVRANSPDYLSQVLENQGFDLRYVEWSDRPSKRHGVNPFLLIDNQKHWDELSPNVYFLKNNESGLIKIGYTEDYEGRIMQLSYQFKARLELLGLIHGGRSEEKEVHGMFSSIRADREWFADCDDLRKFISEYCYISPFFDCKVGQNSLQKHSVFRKLMVDI